MFDLGEFMNWVDQASTPEQLIVLGNELVAYTDTLPPDDKRALIDTYRSKLSDRKQSIVGQLDALGDEKLVLEDRRELPLGE